MLTEEEKKLIEAAHYKSTGGVKFFLKRGVSINCQDENGWAPLHWAVLKDCIEVVEVLIEKGAKIDIRDENGQTPLHIAAASGFLSVQRLLLKSGADFSAIDKNGKTPADLAKERLLKN